MKRSFGLRALVLSLPVANSFFASPSRVCRPTTSLSASRNDVSTVTTSLCSLALLTSPLIQFPLHAGADEWGRETEAPTLFTGETVMICKKRGPLGACLETTVRTAENDNDK